MVATFHHRPTAALRPYIERLWGWQEPTTLTLPIATPGLGAELFFHHGNAPRVATASGEQLLDRGHLLCVRRVPLRFLDQHNAGFSVVRVRAGALGRFTRIPLCELHDSQASVRDIWGKPGAELAERVAEAKNEPARVELIERFLLARLGESSADAIAERALGLIYRHHESLTVAQLAARCGLGRRQLERRISSYYGQTPVELRRLARFYHCARRLALEPTTLVLEVALHAGYYDQAHFIREFKRFAGAAPAAFRRACVPKTHFYNPAGSALRILDSHSRSPPHDRPPR